MHRLRAAVVTAAVSAVAVLGGAVTPAQAQDVTVKFGVSAGYWAPTGAICPVSVAPGADGVAVLNAALAKGCITSYDTVSFGGKPFLSCLDGVCQQADGLVTFWAMFDSSPVPAEYGLAEFRADEGDELVFAYTNFAVLTPFYL